MIEVGEEGNLANVAGVASVPCFVTVVHTYVPVHHFCLVLIIVAAHVALC